MRILVTGGHGFIGTPAVAALRAAGHEVIAPRSGEADILNPDDRARIVSEARADTLLHLAWQTTHGAFWTAQDNPDWRDASTDLLETFLDAGGTRAVLAGSCAEYDWTTGAATLPETAPCNPATLYGECKLATWQHCEKRIAQGASIAWGRLFFLMGRNETPTRFMPAIVQPLLAGGNAPMSDGAGLRDFMHADDAGGAFAALALSDATGPVNIASGHPQTLVEIARMAHALIGTGTLEVGALPARAGEPDALVADVSRLRNEVGFTPQHTTMSAIKDCIAFWRAQA